GVFVGMSSADFAFLRRREGKPFSMLFRAADVLAHRLDFRVPAFVVDAACASSLVSIALACASLRRGECDFALASGVNLILSADRLDKVASKAFSPTGWCRPF